MTGQLPIQSSYTDTMMSELETHMDELLSRLGMGQMNSVPYDTAWIARLGRKFPNHGFDDALTWLRYRQNRDGTWGNDMLYYYHDRIISTLMAIIALKTAGGDHELDEERIRRGESALWKLNGRLHLDASDTIAFPVLAVSLIQEAKALGLDVPHNLYRDVVVIEKKLNMLGRNPKLWKYSTMSFSLEAARAYYPKDADFDGSEVLELNYSVGTSPSATAALLLHLDTTNHSALRFLQNLVEGQGDGGAPNVAIIDTFEIAWSLNQLRMSNAISPDHPEVQRALNHLWQAWSPQKGMAFSSYFSVPDLDCTSVAFSVLRWANYAAHADAFAHYEEDDHFFCYPGEIDISLSAHVRMLGALQMAESSANVDKWEQKISKVLRQQDLNGYFWFDKWHVSPYYLTCEAVHSLTKRYQDMAKPRIKWIIKTQHYDGGWGYYGKSTPEETAYCLQSLMYWHIHQETVPSEILDAAARYLWDHMADENYTPLWIGKCLYTPTNVVRASILAALYSYFAAKAS